MSHVDPSDGWGELDPAQFLEMLPDHSSALPLNYNDEGEHEDEDEWQRSLFISEAAEAIFDYYVENFLTSKVEPPLHEVVEKVLAEEHSEIALKDRGYVTLLALAMLRNAIPVSWVFPERRDEVLILISRFWLLLPDDVSDYIAKCEADAHKIQDLKKRILERLPKIISADDLEIFPRITLVYTLVYQPFYQGDSWGNRAAIAQRSRHSCLDAAVF